MGVNVRTVNGVWMHWAHGWPQWRYGTRFPEEMMVRDFVDVQHRTNFPSTLVDE